MSKPDLYVIREKMLVALDAKFAGVPEWEAFRELDRYIAVGEEQTPARGAKKRRTKKRVSYADLGVDILTTMAKPMATAEMVKFIASNRGLSPDDSKVKVNIQSALSHDDRFKNVAWRGGRAWWFKNREVPADEAAGPSLKL